MNLLTGGGTSLLAHTTNAACLCLGDAVSTHMAYLLVPQQSATRVRPEGIALMRGWRFNSLQQIELLETHTQEASKLPTPSLCRYLW